MLDRISAFIDIDGFGPLYETDRDSLWGLSDLMEAVYKIGSSSKRLSIFRLFAYQVGDGFFLVDDSGRQDFSLLVAASVAMHQYTLCKTRHFCRTAVARGGSSDVVGCYPKEVVSNLHNRATSLGEGLMIIFPVMGSAIIRTYKMSQKARKGASNVVPTSEIANLSSGFRIRTDDSFSYVDWIHCDLEAVRIAREILGINSVSISHLERYTREAFEANRCPEDWRRYTLEDLNLQNA